jgi:DNA-binding MarR family transcriptional regulator
MPVVGAKPGLSRYSGVFSSRYRLVIFLSGVPSGPVEEPRIAWRSKLSSTGMATTEPLSPTEEELWRAVMRIVRVMPRSLDDDLIRGAGLTASEYTTIMNLSEAPNRELRMADLANATGLSASRTTRLVDDLQSRGLVTKTASSSDARGNIARLTSRGMTKLKSAWPVHVASVRRRFLDCIDASAVEGVASALVAVAAQLEDTSGAPRRRR